MISIPVQCDVSEERRVTIQLPETVQPGKHEMILVIDSTPTSQSGGSERLMRFAGTVHCEGEDPVAYQRRLREEWE